MTGRVAESAMRIARDEEGGVRVEEGEPDWDLGFPSRNTETTLNLTNFLTATQTGQEIKKSLAAIYCMSISFEQTSLIYCQLPMTLKLNSLH